MTTTSTTTNTKQTIKLLTLLQQYEALHTNANDNLKLSIFNITKARKFGSSGGLQQQYSPDDVREELRAFALLELQDDIDDGNVDDIEPNLVHEDVLSSGNDDGVKISGGSEGGRKKFVLHLDGMRDVATAKQQTDTTVCQQIDDKTIGAENIESDGLRRRRRGKADDTTSSNKATLDKNKWIIEQTPNETSSNDEEQRLQSVDPINLFGVPPPALKVAQTKSRYAIAYYVEVANLAREIMNITNQE